MRALGDVWVGDASWGAGEDLCSVPLWHKGKWGKDLLESWEVSGHLGSPEKLVALRLFEALLG